MVQFHDFSTYSRFTNFAFFSPRVMFGRRRRRLRGIILRLIIVLQIPLGTGAINIWYNDKNKVKYKIYHLLIINVIIP